MGRVTHRSLGLTVPVSEVLDPALWRERYAWGINMGGVVDAVNTDDDCNKAPSSSSTGSSCSVTDEEASAAMACAGAMNGVGSLVNRVAVLDKIRNKQAAMDTLQAVTEVPDRVIRWHLRAALSELELKLGVPCGMSEVRMHDLDEESGVKGRDYDVVRPRLPWTHSDQRQWYKLDLPAGIIKVRRLRAYFYGTKVYEISENNDAASLLFMEWPRQGGFHMIPINLLSQFVVQNGHSASFGIGLWERFSVHRAPIPDVWSIDYLQGPVSRDGQVGHIEAVLANWCYAVAGMTLLSQAGLAQSKGLASTSLSFDGVSKSVSTTASAIYGLNSALEQVYEKLTERIDWKRMRAAKRGIKVFMYTGH